MNSDSVFNWLDIFKSPAAKFVELLPENPYLSDGILRYRCAGKCAAIELKREYSNNNGTPTIILDVLIEGNTPELFPGDRITVDGESFELAKIELCRSISGTVIARRCTIK